MTKETHEYKLNQAFHNRKISIGRAIWEAIVFGTIFYGLIALACLV